MKLEYSHNINFYSDKINQVKFDLIKRKAMIITNFKNELSQWIIQNPDEFIKLSKFDFQKLKNTQIEGLVGREIQPAIDKVYINYQAKLNTLNSNIKFKIQDKIVYTFYKNNTKNKKIGELKSKEIKFKSTDLSKVCIYLTKYYNPTLIPYIQSQLNKDIDNDMKEFYNLILHYIDKFGDRLINLCLNKKKQLFNELFTVPLVFKPKTYTAKNTCKILNYNKNKKSKISNFISLSGFTGITKDGRLHIPVSFNKKYHRNIELYDNKSKQVTYTITITDDNRIKISLTFSNTKDINIDNSESIGVDANIKHNLFTLSNGHQIDFDRELIKSFIKTKLKFNKKRKLNYVFSKKQEIRLIKWNRKLDGFYKSKTHELIKYCKDNQIEHISCEDLLIQKKIKTASVLHLNNFKNIIESQCINNNIQFSLVPSNYTSQRCSCCGYIDSNNRKTQEQFHCLNCNHEENADINAAKNIKFYKDSDVLSEKLLKQNDYKWYVPKSLTKDKIKEILFDSFEYS